MAIWISGIYLNWIFFQFYLLNKGTKTACRTFKHTQRILTIIPMEIPTVQPIIVVTFDEVSVCCKSKPKSHPTAETEPETYRYLVWPVFLRWLQFRLHSIVRLMRVDSGTAKYYQIFRCSWSLENVRKHDPHLRRSKKISPSFLFLESDILRSKTFKLL